MSKEAKYLEDDSPVGNVIDGRVMWLRSQYNQGVKTSNTRAANTLYGRVRRAKLASAKREGL